MVTTCTAPEHVGRHRAYEDEPTDPWAHADAADDLAPVHAFPLAALSLRPHAVRSDVVGGRQGVVYASRFAAATREEVVR